MTFWLFLRRSTVVNIEVFEYFREVMKCKKRSFVDFVISTKLRYSDSYLARMHLHAYACKRPKIVIMQKMAHGELLNAGKNFIWFFHIYLTKIFWRSSQTNLRLIACTRKRPKSQFLPKMAKWLWTCKIAWPSNPI